MGTAHFLTRILLDSSATVLNSITTQRPILTNEPSDAMPLIQEWFQKCISEHDKCKCDEFGGLLETEESVKLQVPTRVLLVSGSLDPDIKLVKSKGQRGRYCILSYCWGSQSEHHLTTLDNNIKSHLACIQFATLPKTFRDAVIITRSLGIEYLWIDSLCIIQKDHDDWKEESEMMGHYYQNAALMIGAAGVKDPSEGCFLIERPKTPKLTTPIFDGNGSVIGQVFISLKSEKEDDVSESPLRTSSRMVSFKA